MDMEIGDIVVAGYGDDADLGRVVAIVGDIAIVAWDVAMVQTPYPVDWPPADRVYAAGDEFAACRELRQRS